MSTGGSFKNHTMQTAQLQDINEARPLVINSYDQLLDVMKIVLSDAGMAGVKPDEKQPLSLEVNTRTAMKMMRDKGHHCSSYPGWIAFRKNYKLKPKRKGKEDWYLVADLNKIPSRN